MTGNFEALGLLVELQGWLAHESDTPPSFVKAGLGQSQGPSYCLAEGLRGADAGGRHLQQQGCMHLILMCRSPGLLVKLQGQLALESDTSPQLYYPGSVQSGHRGQAAGLRGGYPAQLADIFRDLQT